MCSRTTTSNSPACTFSIFFFNDTATTEIYTLSLHDALPISADDLVPRDFHRRPEGDLDPVARRRRRDRKSTRLNSSHVSISYAVFCLKKKKINPNILVTYENKNSIEHYDKVHQTVMIVKSQT